MVQAHFSDPYASHVGLARRQYAGVTPDKTRMALYLGKLGGYL